MTTRTFKFDLRRVEKQTKDGKKFNTYYTINGDMTVTVKFCKDCKAPSKSGTLILENGMANLSVDDKNYPVWWIKDYIKFEEFKPEPTDLSQYYEEVK